VRSTADELKKIDVGENNNDITPSLEDFSSPLDEILSPTSPRSAVWIWRPMIVIAYLLSSKSFRWKTRYRRWRGERDASFSKLTCKSRWRVHWSSERRLCRKTIVYLRYNFSQFHEKYTRFSIFFFFKILWPCFLYDPRIFVCKREIRFEPGVAPEPHLVGMPNQ